MNGETPTSIGSDRQLFVDEYWIDRRRRVARRLHSPAPREVAIAIDHPWETLLSPYASVFRDGGRYRMWYRCDRELAPRPRRARRLFTYEETEEAIVKTWPDVGRGNVDELGQSTPVTDPGPISKASPEGPVLRQHHHLRVDDVQDAMGLNEVMDPRFTAYAESEDGIHWVKPRLGLLEFEGSKDNNLVWMGPGLNLDPFLDANPNAPDEESYKAIVRNDVTLGGLWGVVSPDGLRWSLMQEEPILTAPPFDTQTVSFWDPWRGEYVLYTRGVAGVGDFLGGLKWIRRATSEDFRHWTPLEPIDTGEAPLEHLYTNSCVRYERAPGTYLMFPSRYDSVRRVDPDWPEAGLNDIVFMSSRDGIHFDRSFMEAFLRPGLDRENWHERAIFMEHGLLQLSPTELSIWVTEHKALPSVRYRRYTVRTDGFVSVNAGYSGGEFTTRPLVFAGNEMEVNYSTSAVGSVRVEIQDAEGHPQPGFTMDECPETFGDEIEGVIRWQNGSDVGALAGRPARLRFALKDADLYAFRFR